MAQLRFGMPPAAGLGGHVTVTLVSDDGDEVRLTWCPDHRVYIRRNKDEDYKAFVARVIAYVDKHC